MTNSLCISSFLKSQVSSQPGGQFHFSTGCSANRAAFTHALEPRPYYKGLLFIHSSIVKAVVANVNILANSILAKDVNGYFIKGHLPFLFHQLPTRGRNERATAMRAAKKRMSHRRRREEWEDFLPWPLLLNHCTTSSRLYSAGS